MPRKITSITIENYRGWYGPYPAILTPNGENLLTYGENGSGKSSLFKGVQNFFRSSIDGNPAFELNIFSALSGNTAGKVAIEFTDFPPDPPATAEYQYSLQGFSTNAQPFINDTRKLNSFLDYKHMLGVHFTDPDSSSTPNLFLLLVEILLGAYQLPATGHTIKEDITQIENGLKRKVNSRHYRDAVANIPMVQGALGVLVGEILTDANRLLSNYFDNDIEIQISSLEFVVRPENQRIVDKRLGIQIRYAGQPVVLYNYFLNEARLSAISICFYLAGVLSHPPMAINYKILYLDDIFIGLDTSNRVPLLKLLQNEFDDYQIFINTYDRFWYEVAKNWFDKNMKDRWVYREMYVHRKQLPTGGPAFDTTIVVNGGSDFAKALYHLNNAYQPDYPAAANYLRKYAEGILRSNIPEIELKVKDGDNYGEFPDFIMLNELIKNTIKFLGKIGQDDLLVKQLKMHSKRLLNPLSHYDPATPIFKRELHEVVDLLPRLEQYLQDLSRNVYQRSLAIHSLLRMKFEVTVDDFIFYEIKIGDQMYKYHTAATGVVRLSDPVVKSIKTYKQTAGVMNSPAQRVNNYLSITEAYNSIHTFILTLPGCAGVVQSADWVDAFEFKDTTGSWVNLNTLTVWP